MALEKISHLILVYLMLSDTDLDRELKTIFEVENLD